MENGNSRILFIVDLVILHGAFLAVFRHYTGVTLIPLKGGILMGLIVVFWFLISVNSDILKSQPMVARPSGGQKHFDRLFSVKHPGYRHSGHLRRIQPQRQTGPLSPALRIHHRALGSSGVSDHLQTDRQIRVSTKIGIDRRRRRVGQAGHRATVVDPATGLSHLRPTSRKRLQKSRWGNSTWANPISWPACWSRHRIDEVIIAKPLSEAPVIKGIVDCCETAGLRFSIVPDFYNIVPRWTVLNSLGDIPVIAVRNDPLNIFGNRMIKRTFDIVVSLAGLLVLSPLLLVIAAAIKATSPGPVLFRQQRIGNNNAEFTLFKFRSMVVQSCRQSDTTWTMPG